MQRIHVLGEVGPGGGCGAESPRAAPRRRPQSAVKLVVLAILSAVCTVVTLAAAWVGLTVYRIDHAVHHVGVPAALLVGHRDDLLAMVKGPDHCEQVLLLRSDGGHSDVSQIPSTLLLPVGGGRTATIGSLSLRHPSTAIAGLARLGLPVGRYVGIDLHMVSPTSELGRLAVGTLSATTLLSDPVAASSLLEQVASHLYLGPGTPMSAVLSLMAVSTSHPVLVPTVSDGHGRVLSAVAPLRSS